MLRRGSSTLPIVGIWKGVCITEQSRLWPPFRINALQASLLSGGFFVYKHKVFILTHIHYLVLKRLAPQVHLRYVVYFK